GEREGTDDEQESSDNLHAGFSVSRERETIRDGPRTKFRAILTLAGPPPILYKSSWRSSCGKPAAARERSSAAPWRTRARPPSTTASERSSSPRRRSKRRASTSA